MQEIINYYESYTKDLDFWRWLRFHELRDKKWIFLVGNSNEAILWQILPSSVNQIVFSQGNLLTRPGHPMATPQEVWNTENLDAYMEKYFTKINGHNFEWERIQISRKK